jgi:UTP--glucose-1-phosphate uridylyltransferase
MTKSKKNLFDKMNEIIPSHVSCIYLMQGEPLGLGHAILQAKPVLGNDPFAVVLADDLIDSEKGALKQMVEKYNDPDTSIISVEKIKKEDSVHYGMIETEDNNENMQKLSGIIEKPKPKDAPSSFGVVGRYIFTNKIISFLEKTKIGTGNEIQLTDAIKELLSTNTVYAYQFSGTRYDCGDKLGFIKANIEYALKNKGFGDELKSYLKSRLNP